MPHVLPLLAASLSTSWPAKNCLFLNGCQCSQVDTTNEEGFKSDLRVQNNSVKLNFTQGVGNLLSMGLCSFHIVLCGGRSGSSWILVVFGYGPKLGHSTPQPESVAHHWSTHHLCVVLQKLAPNQFLSLLSSAQNIWAVWLFKKRSIRGTIKAS